MMNVTVLQVHVMVLLWAIAMPTLATCGTTVLGFDMLTIDLNLCANVKLNPGIWSLSLNLGGQVPGKTP